MEIKIGKTYTTKKGVVKYSPLKFSKCSRFVYCYVEYSNGNNKYDWFFKNARQFEKEFIHIPEHCNCIKPVHNSIDNSAKCHRCQKIIIITNK